MNEGQATMNIDAVRSIADAVLYEGYILYPYRASSQKNQSRWQFGVVMAPGYAAADPSESSFTQAEVVLAHTGQPAVQVLLRFLQVQRRTTEGSGQGWDEAVEREIEVTAEAPRSCPTAWSSSSPSPAARTASRSRIRADRSAPHPSTRSAAGSRWPAWCPCGRPRFPARGVRSGSRSGWRTGPRSARCRHGGTTRSRRR